MSNKFVEILFNGQNLMALQYILYACKCRISIYVKALDTDSNVLIIVIIFFFFFFFFEISAV